MLNRNLCGDHAPILNRMLALGLDDVPEMGWTTILGIFFLINQCVPSMLCEYFNIII